MSSACPRVLLLLLFLCFAPRLAHADLKINEFYVRTPEFFEIFNSGPDTVDMSEWQIHKSPHAAQGLNGILPPGGFKAFSTWAQNEIPDYGGRLLLLHTKSKVVADAVSYGIFGGAPSSRGSASRYPDGHDTGDDARDFEFLPASHFGYGTRSAPNLPTAPQLGSGVVLNEIKWHSATNSETSAIELYNPTNLEVDLFEYWISDGDGMCRITAHLSLSAGGLRVLREGVPGEGLDCTGAESLTFDNLDVIYLYRPPSGGEVYPVRIDQLGLFDSPSYGDPTQSYQRCPDGEGPNDGHDYPSSGGGNSYLSGPPTLGASNNSLCVVQSRSSTWGRLKNYYR